MKLLDTNVVVYAIGGPHPYMEPCRRLLQDIAQGSNDYAIDVELLQEVLHIYSYRARRREAIHVFDRLIRVFPHPLPVREEEVKQARELLDRYERLSPRDAIHAAVVQAHDLEGIITTDRTFREIRGLAVFDPKDVVTGR